MRKPRSKNNDLTGQRFGRWLVIDRAFKSQRRGSMWNCRCECGQFREVSLSNLRGGLSQSCGCFARERTSESKLKYETNMVVASPEYEAWQNMKRRCFDPKNKSYKDYGERGITVCERWKDSFTNFLSDMGSRPGLAYTIERKDVNGIYEPDNCIWLHKSKQARNKRNSRKFTHCGQTKTISEWAVEYNTTPGALNYRLRVKKMPFLEAATTPLGKRPVYIEYRGERMRLSKVAKLCGIDRDCLETRIKLGWDIERATTEPLAKRVHNLTFNGKTQRLTEWAREIGMNPITLHARISAGWSVDESLSTPVNGPRKST